MAKSVYVTVEIFEGHEDNCSGFIPDRCQRNSVTGRVELSADTLQQLYPELLRTRVVELTDGAWERFIELRAARAQP